MEEEVAQIIAQFDPDKPEQLVSLMTRQADWKVFARGFETPRVLEIHSHYDFDHGVRHHVIKLRGPHGTQRTHLFSAFSLEIQQCLQLFIVKQLFLCNTREIHSRTVRYHQFAHNDQLSPNPV